MEHKLRLTHETKRWPSGRCHIQAIAPKLSITAIIEMALKSILSSENGGSNPPRGSRATHQTPRWSNGKTLGIIYRLATSLEYRPNKCIAQLVERTT